MQIKNSAEGVATLRASLTRDGIQSLRDKVTEACTAKENVKENWDDPIFEQFEVLFVNHISTINTLCDIMETYDGTLSTLQEALEDYERQILQNNFLGF